MSDDRCTTCGRPVDLHDQHRRFLLPNPVLDLPDQERTPGTWMSHSSTPREPVTA